MFDVNTNYDSLDGGDSPILYNPSDGCYWLPEIVVTPDGNHTDDHYTDYNNDYYDTGNHSDYNEGGGGGNTSAGNGSTPNDQLYLHEGQAALDHVEQDAHDGHVTFFKGIESTSGYKSLEVASDFSICQQYTDLAINALKASTPLTSQLGKCFGTAGLTVDFSQVVIGFSDGTWSASDWCELASFACGGVSFAIGYTPAGFVFGGLSIFFGFLSNKVPGDDGTPGGKGY